MDEVTINNSNSQLSFNTVNHLMLQEGEGEEGNVDMSTCDNSKTMNPMLIDCVIEHCFKYLSVKTISTCRLVSRQWNELACCVLRGKSYVNFNFSEEIYGYLTLMQNCRDNPFKKFVFHIFDHEITHYLVKSLFQNYSETISSVTLDCNSNSRYATHPVNPLAFKSLLEKSVYLLEELRLYGLPENILHTENLFLPSTTLTSLPFLNLKIFGVSIDNWPSKKRYRQRHQEHQNNENNAAADADNDYHENVDFHTSQTALIYDILQYARNLTTFEVGSLPCLSQILQTGCLQRLEKFISIPGKSPGLSREEISSLAQNCPNLKHLNIFVDPNHVSTIELYQMLSHLKNLEYLYIRGGPNDVNNFGIDFPFMPNLKHISIYQAKIPLDQLISSLPCLETARISIHPYDYLIMNQTQTRDHQHHHHSFDDDDDLEPMDYSNSRNYNNDCDNVVENVEEEEEEKKQVMPSCNSSNSPSKRQLQFLYTSHNHARESEMMNMNVMEDPHNNNNTTSRALSFTNFLVNIRLKFPLISRLRLNVDTNEEMLQIYQLECLKDLHVEDGSDISDKDITGIQYSDLFKFYEGRSNWSGSENDIKNGRHSPYIGNLRRLKRLYLGSIKITNASIIFGLVDLIELTSLSIKEPQFRITENGENQLIRNHSFCLEILASRLKQLVRIEVTETQSQRGESHNNNNTNNYSRPTAVTPEEINAVKKITPHLQLVYITSPDTLGKVKVLNY